MYKHTDAYTHRGLHRHIHKCLEAWIVKWWKSLAVIGGCWGSFFCQKFNKEVKHDCSFFPSHGKTFIVYVKVVCFGGLKGKK